MLSLEDIIRNTYLGLMVRVRQLLKSTGMHSLVMQTTKILKQKMYGWDVCAEFGWGGEEVVQGTTRKFNHSYRGVIGCIYEAVGRYKRSYLLHYRIYSFKKKK